MRCVGDCRRAYALLTTSAGLGGGVVLRVPIFAVLALEILHGFVSDFLIMQSFMRSLMAVISSQSLPFISMSSLGV